MHAVKKYFCFVLVKSKVQIFHRYEISFDQQFAILSIKTIFLFLDTLHGFQYAPPECKLKSIHVYLLKKKVAC